jgi:hypothetical protein
VEALLELGPIVRQTCRDFNVTYRHYDNYLALLDELVAYVRPFAAKPQVVGDKEDKAVEGPQRATGAGELHGESRGQPQRGSTMWTLRKRQ